MNDEKKTKSQLIKEINHMRDMEAKYLYIIENMKESIVRITPNGRFLDFSPALAALYGYDSIQEMVSEDSELNQVYLNSVERKKLLEALERGDASVEMPIRKRNGSICWVMFRSRTIRDVRGRSIYYVCNLEDITERKRKEDALLDENEALRKRVNALERQKTLLQGVAFTC